MLFVPSQISCCKTTNPTSTFCPICVGFWTPNTGRCYPIWCCKFRYSMMRLLNLHNSLFVGQKYGQWSHWVLYEVTQISTTCPDFQLNGHTTWNILPFQVQIFYQNIFVPVRTNWKYKDVVLFSPIHFHGCNDICPSSCPQRNRVKWEGGFLSSLHWGCPIEIHGLGQIGTPVCNCHCGIEILC